MSGTNLGTVDELANELGARLARGLCLAIRRLLELFGLELEPRLREELKKAAAHALHITIHELSHPLAHEAIPWLRGLPEPDRTFVEELLARMVERAVSLELKGLLGEEAVLIEGFEDWLLELSCYGPLRDLKISVEDLEDLFRTFQEHIRRPGGARDFAEHLLRLREQFLPGRR